MKRFYLLANGQPNDRAIYYTGKEDFHGGELWGNVNDAYRFNSLSELFDVIKIDDCVTPIIVEIREYELEIIERGYKDLWNGVESTDHEVYNAYNTVSCITNSRPC